MLRTTPAQRRIWSTFLAATFIILGTIAAINYAQGSWRLTQDGFELSTGLLAANSLPPGAEIYLADRLVSATDDTLYLSPNTYQVTIRKDGYWPWTKELQIEEQLVTQTNAQLFPIAPSLTPLITSGIDQLLPSPDGQRLLLYLKSNGFQQKSGWYVLELTSGPLTFGRQTRAVVTETSEDRPSLAEALAIWSPDSSQILFLTGDKEFLIDANQSISAVETTDISSQRNQILQDWEKEMAVREKQFLSRFPQELVQIITSQAINVYFSPDKKRLLYTPLTSVSLAENLVPPIPSRNTQAQERSLKPGMIYIYDREEDTNFQVGIDSTFSAETPVSSQATVSDRDKNPEETNSLETLIIAKSLLTRRVDPAAEINEEQTQQANQSTHSLRGQATEETAARFRAYHSALFTHGLQWFTDSKHLLFVDESAIKIKEYDDANQITLYAGPFQEKFIFPWSDGSRLVIKTTFGAETPANVYAIEIK